MELTNGCRITCFGRRLELKDWFLVHSRRVTCLALVECFSLPVANPRILQVKDEQADEVHRLALGLSEAVLGVKLSLHVGKHLPASSA